MNTANKRWNQAFTLVEIMVVVMIISILASVALPNLRRMINEGQKAEMFGLAKTFYTAIETYQAKTGSYPENLNSLSSQVPPFIDAGTITKYGFDGASASSGIYSKNCYDLLIQFNNGYEYIISVSSRMHLPNCVATRGDPGQGVLWAAPGVFITY